MKIIFTSDIHYPITDLNTIKHFAEIANSYDLIVFAGDIATNSDDIKKVFSLFKIPIAFTTGNHDLYSQMDFGSEIKYFYDYTNIKTAHFLDEMPLIYENFAIVGCMGWYDLTFKDKSLSKYGVNDSHYQNQTFSNSELNVNFMWNDINYIKWSYDNDSFMCIQLKKMKSHLEQTKNIQTVIFVSHFLPYKELLDSTKFYKKMIKDNKTIPKEILNHIRRVSGISWRFGNAFQGSSKMGNLLNKYDNIKYVICGHSHIEKKMIHKNKQLYSIGSDYKLIKHFVLEI